jgi:hypothetical protein
VALGREQRAGHLNQQNKILVVTTFQHNIGEVSRFYKREMNPAISFFNSVGFTASGLMPGLVLRILSGQAAGLDAKERMRRTSAPTE